VSHSYPGRRLRIAPARTFVPTGPAIVAPRENLYAIVQVFSAHFAKFFLNPADLKPTARVPI
jgi:hypothetical protein